MGQALRAFAGRKITVASFLTDHEAYILSAQIADAMRCAGLDVTDWSGKAHGGLAERTGVEISAATRNNPSLKQ